MWLRVTLAVLTVSCLAVDALVPKCGDVIKNATEETIGVPTGLVAKTACTITIERPKDDLTTTLHFAMVSIAPKDALVIYDGKDALLANFTGELVARQVLIGFQQNTTIVFTPDAATTKSTWSLDFDTKSCEVNIENTWTTSFSSPRFLKTAAQGTLQCVFTVTSFLPADQIAAAAFNAFSLAGESTLTISRAHGNLTYTSDSPQNDFFAEGAAPLVLTLSIADTRTVQSFSLVVEPVLEECSGEVTVNGTLDVAKAFPSSSSVTAGGRSTSCRWLLSSDRPLLHAQVTSLQVATGDALVFRAGGSSQVAAMDTLVKGLVDPYLVVTSENTLLVTFTMGVVKDARELNITFLDADNGGHFEGQGYLSAEASIANEDVYFSLVASPGQWVDVSSMTNLTNGSTVTFYDGAQATSSVLTIWSADNQDLSPVTGHEQMLVVLSNLAAGELFNASFTSVPAGCDTLTSESSGEMIFSAASTLLKDQTCTWTVAPLDAEGTVVLSLNSVSLREKESLTVTSGLDSKGQVLAQFSGPQLTAEPLPQVHVPAAEKFRVTFTRVKASSPFTGAIVQYRIVPNECGGELNQASGQIQTPNYPNQYPLNARCSWIVGSSSDKAPSDTSVLLVSFSSLALAQDHSISVLRHVENKTEPPQMAKYGGISSSPSSLPNDLILPKAPELDVIFSSEPSSNPTAPKNINQVAGGASLSYWVLECGGNITASNGSFTSPEFSKAPTKSALCVWILNVAAVKGADNSTNILAFNITTVGKDAKSIGKYLTIHDGPTLRSPAVPLSAAASNLSRYDSIVVVFNLTVDGSSKPDVRVNISYTTINCNSSQQCANGICLHPDWICNGVNDCGDNSDEQNCVIPPPSPKPPKPSPPQDYSGWVKSGWVPGCLFIGLLLGAGLVWLAPRVYRRLRSGRPGNYNRMDSPSIA